MNSLTPSSTVQDSSPRNARKRCRPVKNGQKDRNTYPNVAEQVQAPRTRENELTGDLGELASAAETSPRRGVGASGLPLLSSFVVTKVRLTALVVLQESSLTVYTTSPRSPLPPTPSPSPLVRLFTSQLRNRPLFPSCNSLTTLQVQDADLREE